MDIENDADAGKELEQNRHRQKFGIVDGDESSILGPGESKDLDRLQHAPQAIRRGGNRDAGIPSCWRRIFQGDDDDVEACPRQGSGFSLKHAHIEGEMDRAENADTRGRHGRRLTFYGGTVIVENWCNAA